MSKIIKNDFYRLLSSTSFYVVLLSAMFISAFLSLALRSDIRIGISIFGNLTAFKSAEDLIILGTKYYKGLGILIAIIISIFIGQEYLYNTLCHKWNITKNRTGMYLSKVLLSCTVSAIIYLIFQTMILLFSGNFKTFSSPEYLLMVFSGVFPYIALGSIFTLISTISKNNVYAIIACLAYVLLSNTLINFVFALSNSFPFLEVFASHSIYGISKKVNIAITISKSVYLLVNSLFIVMISSIVGIFVFKNQEI